MTEITDLSPTDSSNTSISGESLDGAIANMGRMDNTLQATMGMLARSIRTNVLRFLDHTDDTKELALDLSQIATGTTRTLSVTNASGAILTTGAQTFSQDVKYQVAQNIGQAWEQIGSVITLSSNAADISWTGISDYRGLRLTAEHIRLTANAQILLQMGQGSYQSAGSYDTQYIRTGGTTVEAGADAAASGIILAPECISGSDGGAFGVLALLGEFNQNRVVGVSVSNMHRSSAGVMRTYQAGSRMNTLLINDRLRLVPSAGQFAAGTRVVLEGIRG